MNDGARLLGKFLDKNGVSIRAAGTALDVTHVAVRQWIRGTNRPGTHLRRSIERWTTGFVPASSWETKAEREAGVKVVPFAARQSRGPRRSSARAR